MANTTSSLETLFRQAVARFPYPLSDYIPPWEEPEDKLRYGRDSVGSEAYFQYYRMTAGTLVGEELEIPGEIRLIHVVRQQQRLITADFAYGRDHIIPDEASTHLLELPAIKLEYDLPTKTWQQVTVPLLVVTPTDVVPASRPGGKPYRPNPTTAQLETTPDSPIPTRWQKLLDQVIATFPYALHLGDHSWLSPWYCPDILSCVQEVWFEAGSWLNQPVYAIGEVRLFVNEREDTTRCARGTFNVLIRQHGQFISLCRMHQLYGYYSPKENAWVTLCMTDE